MTRHDNWENTWTERLTYALILLFLAWMMLIAWNQPDPVTLIPESDTISPAPSPEEATHGS